MTRIFILLVFSWSFGAKAQLNATQLGVENNQIVLAAQDLEFLLTHGLLDSLEMQQLNLFFLGGGEVLNWYQLQGLLSQTALSKIFEIIPYLLLPVNKFSTTLTSFDPATIQFKAEFRTILPNFRMEQQHWKAIQDTNHLGPPVSLDFRAQLNISNWRFGCHLSKDAGEPIWQKGISRGFDFSSAYAFWKNPTKGPVLQKLLIGSYQMQWGQGLQLWSSRAMGKSIDLLQMVRTPQGLQPYQGNDEQRFLQGAALQLQKKAYAIILFGSFKYTDAKKIKDTTQLDLNFSYSTGYHRTAFEIERRQLLQEQIFGLALCKRSAIFQSGMMLLYNQSRARSSIPDSLMSILQLSPVQLFSAGYNVQASWRQFYFYGEGVLSLNSKMNLWPNSAVNLALIYLVDPKLELGLHYRFYAPNYRALYANPIGNSSLGMNERGLIVHVKCQLKRHTVFKLASEWCPPPFLIIGSVFPITRQETRLQFEHQSSRKNSIHLQVAQRSFNGNTILWNAQLHYTFLPLLGQDFDLIAQVNMKEPKQGMQSLLAFGWRYAPLNKAIRWEIKYGIFQNNWTESYMLTHLYLLGVGSQTLALNGVGSFTMAVLRWSVSPQWQMQIHGNYCATYAAPNQQKIQFGGLLRYQF